MQKSHQEITECYVMPSVSETQKNHTKKQIRDGQGGQKALSHLKGGGASPRNFKAMAHGRYRQPNSNIARPTAYRSDRYQ